MFRINANQVATITQWNDRIIQSDLETADEGIDELDGKLYTLASTQFFESINQQIELVRKTKVRVIVEILMVYNLITHRCYCLSTAHHCHHPPQQPPHFQLVPNSNQPSPVPSIHLPSGARDPPLDYRLPPQAESSPRVARRSDAGVCGGAGEQQRSCVRSHLRSG